MWQEARKQEKHIKTIMVDYRRRAERRRDFYERIKEDPIKFLRVYGRPSKLSLDPEIAKAAENPNTILASMDRIEHRLCMYERYRGLIHNDYAGVTEAMALKQIESDEKYNDVEKKRKEEEANKKLQEPKAAIGFTYMDSTTTASLPTSQSNSTGGHMPDDSDSEEEADSDMDIDVELDAANLTVDDRHQLAKSAANFGLHSTDFVRLLEADQQLETELRLAKALEEEKLQLGGRKSRRARRMLKERRSQEKFPKMITTKIGLLNGQPISRRTVYLSASSSDSGDYPSDEDEVELDNQRRNFKSAAVRDRRIRAKPLLTNARGPSVLIGGMTSVTLCRRPNGSSSRGDVVPVGTEKSGGCRVNNTRSSSSSSSSVAVGRRGGGRRSSSGSTDRSRSDRRSRHQGKRSRVEYITTFGDNAEDDKRATGSPNAVRSGGPMWKTGLNPPGAAATSVAASVVSKLLHSGQKPNSQQQKHQHSSSIAQMSSERKPLPTFTKNITPSNRHGMRKRNSSSPDSSYRRSNYRTSSPPNRRRRSRSRSFDKSNRSFRDRHHRRRHSSSRSTTTSSRSSRSGRNTGRRRGSRSSSVSRSHSGRSKSRSPLSQRLTSASLSVRTGSHATETSKLGKIGSGHGGFNPTRGDQAPSPPIRKRYYRPELESDGEANLSDEAEQGEHGKPVPHSSDRRSWGQSGGVRHQDHSHHSIGGGTSAGKMTTQPGGPFQGASSTAPTNTTRPTPQELLNRRVQLQLSKALDADKRVEMAKQVQLEQERKVREDGLRRRAALLKRQEDKRARAERRASGTAGISDLSSSPSSALSEDEQSYSSRSGYPPISKNRSSPTPGRLTSTRRSPPMTSSGTTSRSRRSKSRSQSTSGSSRSSSSSRSRSPNGGGRLSPSRSYSGVSDARRGFRGCPPSDNRSNWSRRPRSSGYGGSTDRPYSNRDGSNYRQHAAAAYPDRSDPRWQSGQSSMRPAWSSSDANRGAPMSRGSVWSSSSRPSPANSRSRPHSSQYGYTRDRYA